MSDSRIVAHITEDDRLEIWSAKPGSSIVREVTGPVVTGDLRLTLHSGNVARWFSVEHDVALMPLAFDHAEILRTAVERIRGKIDYAPSHSTWCPRRSPWRN